MQGLKMNFKWTSLSYCFVSILFLIVGWKGLQEILSSNKCNMTYSRPNFNEVFIGEKNALVGFKLWKHDSQTRDSLNEQPVLFVPGHYGRLVEMNYYFF